MLAWRIVAIVGHWKLSLFTLVVVAKRTNFGGRGSAQEKAVKIWAAAIAAGILMISGCNQAAPSNSSQPLDVQGREPEPPVPPPGTGPDTKTPLGKPEMAIDPKSPEAAVQLAQEFADLINSRRIKDAYRLLRPGVRPRDQFEESFSGYSALQVSVGKHDAEEGAAGSLYLTVPLTITGIKHGAKVRDTALLTLRRVNDVPGSSEADRRWHVEDIVWMRYE